MNRQRTAPRRTKSQQDPLAEWEADLLGISGLSPRKQAAHRRALARMAAVNSRRPGSYDAEGKKPKTAAQAEQSRLAARAHKKGGGGRTSEGKPRKSRRSIRRELYGQGEQKR